MSLPATVAGVIQDHVTLAVECLDRLYLNVIQSRLQVERGIAYFFQRHRGERFATAKTMAEAPSVVRASIGGTAASALPRPTSVAASAAVNDKPRFSRAARSRSWFRRRLRD